MAIGDNIHKFRKLSRLTQKELAIKCGLSSTGIISQFENNNAKPTLQTLIKLAEALGITANDLLYDKEK